MSLLGAFGAWLSRLAFFRFAFIGALGMVVDEGVLFAMLHLVGSNPYSGRCVSWFCAASFTWFGNRHLTFHEQRALGIAASFKEWLRFLGANAVGGLVNIGLYATLVKFAPPPLDNPFLALICGVALGLVFNFTLSKWLVFRARSS